MRPRKNVIAPWPSDGVPRKKSTQQDSWNSDETEALEKTVGGNHSNQKLRSSWCPLGVTALPSKVNGNLFGLGPEKLREYMRSVHPFANNLEDREDAFE